MAYQSIHHQSIILYPVVSRNPTKEPRAERNAFSPVPSTARYSPTNAPMKGPIIIPKGGKANSPAIIPISDPRVHALLPPYFLVPRIGRK